MSLTAIWAAIKGAPFFVILGLLAVLGAGYAYYEVRVSHLESSLSTVQANLGKALQSNKSLELENQKRQKEFEANEIERSAVQTKDAELSAKGRKVRADIVDMTKKQEEIRDTKPEEFLKEINRQVGCQFEGYGVPSTCEPMNNAPQEK